MKTIKEVTQEQNTIKTIKTIEQLNTICSILRSNQASTILTLKFEGFSNEQIINLKIQDIDFKNKMILNKKVHETTLTNIQYALRETIEINFEGNGFNELPKNDFVIRHFGSDKVSEDFITQILENIKKQYSVTV